MLLGNNNISSGELQAAHFASKETLLMPVMPTHLPIKQLQFLQSYIFHAWVESFAVLSVNLYIFVFVALLAKMQKVSQ